VPPPSITAATAAALPSGSPLDPLRPLVLLLAHHYSVCRLGVFNGACYCPLLVEFWADRLHPGAKPFPTYCTVVRRDFQKQHEAFPTVRRCERTFVKHLSGCVNPLSPFIIRNALNDPGVPGNCRKELRFVCVTGRCQLTRCRVTHLLTCLLLQHTDLLSIAPIHANESKTSQKPQLGFGSFSTTT
jgi:hypothetical protein